MRTFKAAHRYIPRSSFVYSFLITTLRAVLILNKVHGFGRYIWHGSPEGKDVLRFFAVLSTVATESVMDALRGEAMKPTSSTCGS